MQLNEEFAACTNCGVGTDERLVHGEEGDYCARCVDDSIAVMREVTGLEVGRFDAIDSLDTEQRHRRAEHGRRYGDGIEVYRG